MSKSGTKFLVIITHKHALHPELICTMKTGFRSIRQAEIVRHRALKSELVISAEIKAAA